MSKVVCDICGTSYPETNVQCPICGCVKPVDANAVIDKDTGDGTYTYVKGGRFSKRNVQKQNVGFSQFRDATPGTDSNKRLKSRTSCIIVITSVVVFLVIVMICAYIFRDVYADFLFGDNTNSSETIDKPDTNKTGENVSNDGATDKKDTADSLQPCTAVELSQTALTLESAQQQIQLNVICTPANTTDLVSYTSDKPEVVLVDDTGKLTAVSEGEATITVICGSMKTTCHITCSFAGESVETPVTKFELNRTDFTLFYAGDSWRIYNGDIPLPEITWSSDDEDVVIVEFGRVVAVGEGVTYVHGEYDGEKHSCIVRVKFSNSN